MVYCFVLSPQIYPGQQVQKAVRADQRGEVDTEQNQQFNELFQAHLVQSVDFRLKRICEIYSKVLGTEEALHVCLHTE